MLRYIRNSYLYLIMTWQGTIVEFAAVCTILYTVMVAITLDMTVVRKVEPPSFFVINAILITIAGVSFCAVPAIQFPLTYSLHPGPPSAVSTSLPYISNSYGNAGMWCWIAATGVVNGKIDIGSIWRYALIFCPGKTYHKITRVKNKCYLHSQLLLQSLS